MDLQLTAVNSVKNARRVFLQDLEALPEEAFLQRYGPKTRTVADIIYEVNMVNDHIGMVIRGEEPFAWPEGDWIYAPADFNTKEVVIAAFDASSAKLLATAEAMSAEEIESTVTTESGPATKFARFQFTVLHMWYHSGQLNFIQTMLGDDGWHWK
jgi:uncharacterized damage-inducible protein DinB